MPTYVYRCQQCGAMLERRQGFTDPPLTECEECSGTLHRVIQPVQVIFKGSGFYSTDYKAKSPTEAEPKTSTNGETKSSTPESKESSDSAPAKTEAATSSSTTESSASKP